VGKLVPVLGGLAVLLIAGSMGAGAQSGAAGASARAYAISVAAPGQSGGGAGSVAAPPDAVGVGGSFSYGSDVTTGAITSSATARTDATSATAEASSEVQSLSLFGGEVTVARVAAHVRAQAGAQGGSGDLSGSSVEGMAVLGQGVDTSSAGARVPIADWGYAIVLGQSSAPAARGYRGFVTALEIHITADHGGLPAGSVVSVGFAEATVSAPPPPPKKPRAKPPTTEPKPGSTPGKQDGSRKPKRGETLPLPNIPEAKLTPGGYVFPVYGTVSYGDTFGAARADTGWHHGEDLFAPLGAPILAVADGAVFSVGWNDIGGNRLWLRDTSGNEFYYAHLSAFSPLARNGRQVHAGDVVGFVGNTGDAEGTPPHLHFEVHPLALLGLGYDGVISPYNYLLAWRRLEDIRFVPGAGWLPLAGHTTAPEPGAYLLETRDISSLSGLDPGSLRRAFAPQPAAAAP
jgi:murein DD-endopeptidase MepM/ murein hydrolase activator NlpD